MTEVRYALSVRQPWATLLVQGLKSIEVRSWWVPRSGRILIHAPRIVDTRPEAWRHVPQPLRTEAEVVGGFIGSAELTGCREYRSITEFAADARLHLNDAAWFVPPLLYGFQFADPRPQLFRR